MPLLLALLSSVLAPEAVEWRKDYAAACAEARKLDRLVLVHFTLEDRPVCKAMDQETYAKPEVVRAIGGRFVAVRADIDANAALLESMLGHGAGLATCVTDAEGDVVSTRLGFADPPQLLAFLEKAAAGYGRIQEARRSAGAGASPASLYSLGEAYRSCDSLRRAEQCYLEAIRKADGTQSAPAAGCHERLARLRVTRGKNLEARKHLLEARRLDPEGASAAKDRLQLTEGLILAVERRHAEAAAVLREGLRLHPGSDERDHYCFSLGFVLHEAKQDQPALETLEEALRLYPQSRWAPAMKEQIGHIKNPQPDHTH